MRRTLRSLLSEEGVLGHVSSLDDERFAVSGGSVRAVADGVHVTA